MSAKEDPYVSSSGSDDDGDDYKGLEDQLTNFGGRTKDLFSENMFPSPQSCLENAEKEHGFDLETLRRRHKLDCFSYFKLINFVRLERPSPQSIMQAKDDGAWNKEIYLKPAIEDDPLLMMDFEDFEEMPKLTEERVTEENGDDSPVILSKSEFVCLQKRLAQLESAASNRDAELSACIANMQSMRLMTQSIIGGGEIDKSDQDLPKKGVAECRTEEDDAGYAGSYAHFSIHHEMLSDTVRTLGYRDAISKNPQSIKGKAVLDLGCGTGILSMFSAKAGAEIVVGVDMSDIIHQAMDVIMENRLGDVIKLVKGRLEDQSSLPVKQFDVIMSEWMGYFLLFEGMIDSVMEARKKYLKTGGTVLPNRCTMHLQLVSDPVRYAETVDFWKDVYGFKMSCMKKPCLVEASVEIVPKEHTASQPVTIHHLDMQTCELKDTEFDSEFVFVSEKDCEITSVAGYFDSFFDLPEHPVSFTTGPAGRPTHWKQTVFYLAEKLPVKKGEEIKGRMEVTRPRRDVRSLEVKLWLKGVEQSYTVE